MKISVNWLRRYVELDWDVETIAERLTSAGIEVEEIHPIRPGFAGVRVGRVEAVRPHPAADRLQIATVRVDDAHEDVVCGAPNCRAGLTVAYAGIGARLPELTIREATIRGVESKGMLCSLSELGLGEGHAGIVELPDTLRSGSLLEEALPVADDVLDLSVTANRGDCLSHLGIARELAALAGVSLRPVDRSLPRVTAGDGPRVSIASPDRCARYVGRLMRGLRVCESPFWMRRLLEAVGVRAINNVVDVTNFVLLEYGQPLHAFDRRDLSGSEISVRRAEDGEPLTTLDGQLRKLSAADLVVCDGSRPVALAGIMGGANSEVKSDTTEILLESAWFEPVGVRETSRRLGLRSESSHRFERFVDPEATREAADRALHLLAMLPGGEAAEIIGGISDVQPRLIERRQVWFPTTETARRLGVSVDPALQREALERFGFEVDTADTARWRVTAPSYRSDVSEPADLVEEIVRYMGYSAIPNRAPRASVRHSSNGLNRRRARRGLERQLNLGGFHQALNFSFVNARRLSEFDQGRPVHLVNPLTEDLAVLRTSLLPGLLENIAHNLRHGAHSVRLFESGTVFRPAPEGGRPSEALELGLAMAGEAHRHWSGARPVDFFDVKGVVEALVASAGGGQLEWRPSERRGLHPHATAECHLDGAPLGVVGVLHPSLARSEGVGVPVVMGELNLARLLARPTTLPRFHEFSRLPGVRRDLALVLPEGTTTGQVLAQIEEFSEPLVDNVEVFDVYEGGELALGERSVGLSVSYRDRQRTLTDEDVSAAHERIVQHLTRCLGVRRR